MVSSPTCVGWSQNYEEEIVDDYITGAEEVGVDPTVPVKSATPGETQEKVDPNTDIYEFKEYDIKEYDNKQSVEKPYEYGDYGDYGPTDAKPTSVTYEEEFGPGVPAETDIRESSVSAGGSECGEGVRNAERWKHCWWCLCGRVCVMPSLFVVSNGIRLQLGTLHMY